MSCAVLGGPRDWLPQYAVVKAMPSPGGTSKSKSADGSPRRASSRVTQGPAALPDLRQYGRLAEYNRKRHFGVTPEPAGQLSPRDAGHPLEFVVQKHRASSLHYDVRFEHRGVMLSWAVPKGPSLDPSVKRLAMETEPHPMDYNQFEGVIPAGEYGGGVVMIWDKGIWAPIARRGSATRPRRTVSSRRAMSGSCCWARSSSARGCWCARAGRSSGS